MITKGGSKDSQQTETVQDAASSILTKSKPSQRTNIKKFIENKREMFLMQQSLDTKRKEIAKLEKITLQREEGLIESETLLNEDVEKFKVYWEKSKNSLQEAKNQADEINKKVTHTKTELKNAQEKVKKLSSEIKDIDQDIQQ
jgi:uncharacterized coiled-coil DUF342 family protein